MASFAFLVLALALHAFTEIGATSNTALDSDDGAFKVQWSYNDSKLIFNLTCQTSGYCALAFSETADGKNMVNYDIAVAGYASGAGYIDDYWSNGVGSPGQDTNQSYKIITASEAGGKTIVEFYRDAETGDAKDVQFKNNTEVKVIFASHSSTDANNNGLTKHDKTKILSGRYNLIALAMMPTTASAAPTTATTPVAYASVMSPDGSFKLEWTYSNSKLMFKMTCKMTGWCAVGFTTTADGRGMKNYDIAVGGFASNAGYITDYWSTTTTKPSKDVTQNFDLTKASENDGKTIVEFSRDAVTGDNANDVQFKDDTEVTVVWAASSSSDANADLVKHSVTGVLSGKHNLIKEAMAAKTPMIPTDTAHAIFPSIVFILTSISAGFLAF